MNPVPLPIHSTKKRADNKPPKNCKEAMCNINGKEVSKYD